ncbi:hypothetical protein MASR2M78_23760 [Treponema sp.]
MLASPLKALSDYVYYKRLDWTSIDPLIESLRIEEDQIAELIQADFDEIEGNYTSLRDRRFLEAFQKDVLK